MSQPGDTSIFQVQWSRVWREGRDTLRGDHNSSLDDVDFLGISARIYNVFSNVLCLHHQMILLFIKKKQKDRSALRYDTNTRMLTVNFGWSTSTQQNSSGIFVEIKQTNVDNHKIQEFEAFCYENIIVCIVCTSVEGCEL